MKRSIHFGLLLALIFILGACAQRYHSVNPTKIALSASNIPEEITLNYRYDILRENGNKKISKNERRNNIKLVAVKITNNTDQVINLSKNAAFFSGSSMLVPIEPISLKNKLRQSVPSYLFYLLLTPLTFTFNGSDPFPIGLFVGPGLTGANMLDAGIANKKLYTELIQYDILNRDIQQGETVYGLVGFGNIDYSPLTIKITK